MRGIIFVDVEKCLGCTICEIECAVAHSQSKNLVESINEKPFPRSRVSVDEIDGLAIPIQCKHCEAASGDQEGTLGKICLWGKRRWGGDKSMRLEGCSFIP